MNKIKFLIISVFYSLILTFFLGLLFAQFIPGDSGAEGLNKLAGFGYAVPFAIIFSFVLAIPTLKYIHKREQKKGMKNRSKKIIPDIISPAVLIYFCLIALLILKLFIF